MPVVLRAEFTPAESRLIQRLREGVGDCVSYETLANALYVDYHDDIPSRASIRVHILRIRRKGIDVQTVVGFGYRLTDELLCPSCGHPRGLP